MFKIFIIFSQHHGYNAIKTAEVPETMDQILASMYKIPFAVKKILGEIRFLMEILGQIRNMWKIWEGFN